MGQFEKDKASVTPRMTGHGKGAMGKPASLEGGSQPVGTVLGWGGEAGGGIRLAP